MRSEHRYRKIAIWRYEDSQQQHFSLDECGELSWVVSYSEHSLGKGLSGWMKLTHPNIKLHSSIKQRQT